MQHDDWVKLISTVQGLGLTVLGIDRDKGIIVARIPRAKK